MPCIPLAGGRKTALWLVVADLVVDLTGATVENGGPRFVVLEGAAQKKGQARGWGPQPGVWCQVASEMQQVCGGHQDGQAPWL